MFVIGCVSCKFSHFRQELYAVHSPFSNMARSSRPLTRMRLAWTLLLSTTLISAHRLSQCTTRTSSSPVARRAAVSCQLPAVAAANACVEATANPLLAYEMVQGADVIASSGRQHPPTCLLTHGILGSRRNLKSFAQRMALDFPDWQFLLVDLRCHGQSSALTPAGPNTVEAAALDVIVAAAGAKRPLSASAAAFSRSLRPSAGCQHVRRSTGLLPGGYSPPPAPPSPPRSP